MSSSLIEYLQNVVDDGNLMRLFVGTQCQSIQRTVDFSVTPPKRDMQQNTFKILLGNTIATSVVCLFPNHTNKSKRILESKHFKNRDEFNKELNQRFADSPDETEHFKNHKLLILYGAHCFICSKISGTVYIVWAERVTRTNIGNTSTIPYVNTPIVINCNKLAKIKSMYLLRPQIENKPNELSLFPLTQGNPILMYDKKYNPFVCEDRPEKQDIRRITAISKHEAYASILQTTKEVGDWLPFEKVPFSHAQNVEQGIEIEHSSYTPWIESPRELLGSSSDNGLRFIKENNNNIIHATLSTTKTEPDPFAQTSDEESSFSKGVEIDLADL